MKKFELRKLAKEIRKMLDIQLISSKIIEKIESSKEFENSRHVLLFYPKDFEINLTVLCEQYVNEKKFYLPKVNGSDMFVCPYSCGEKLAISNFGVYEPCSMPVSPQIIDYAIIPCLCADKRGFRIGYGGGFYDRFLPNLKENCVKIVPVPKNLLFDEVPTDTFDLPVDFVITE